MKRYRIHTPVPGHTEVIGTVAFANGVAECEAEPTAAPLMYFRAQGYAIEELDEDGEWVPENPPVRKRQAPADRMAELEAENAALRAELEASKKPARKTTKAAADDTQKTEEPQS